MFRENRFVFQKGGFEGLGEAADMPLADKHDRLRDTSEYPDENLSVTDKYKALQTAGKDVGNTYDEARSEFAGDITFASENDVASRENPVDGLLAINEKLSKKVETIIDDQGLKGLSADQFETLITEFKDLMAEYEEQIKVVEDATTDLKDEYQEYLKEQEKMDESAREEADEEKEIVNQKAEINVRYTLVAYSFGYASKADLKKAVGEFEDGDMKEWNKRWRNLDEGEKQEWMEEAVKVAMVREEKKAAAKYIGTLEPPKNKTDYWKGEWKDNKDEWTDVYS